MDINYFKKMDKNEKDLYIKEVCLYVGRLGVSKINILREYNDEDEIIEDLLNYFNIKYDSRNPENKVDYTYKYSIETTGYDIKGLPKFDTFEKKCIALEVLFKQGYYLNLSGRNITYIFRIMFNENVSLEQIITEDLYYNSILEILNIINNYNKNKYILGGIGKPLRSSMIGLIEELSKETNTFLEDRDKLEKYLSRYRFLLINYFAKDIVSKKDKSKKDKDLYLLLCMFILNNLEKVYDKKDNDKDYLVKITRNILKDFLYEDYLINYLIKYVPSNKIYEKFIYSILWKRNNFMIIDCTKFKGKLSGTYFCKRLIIDGKTDLFKYLDLKISNVKEIVDIIREEFSGDIYRKNFLARMETVTNRGNNVTLDLDRYIDSDDELPFKHLKQYGYNRRENEQLRKYIGIYYEVEKSITNIMDTLYKCFYNNLIKLDKYAKKSFKESDFLKDGNYKDYGFNYYINEETNEFISYYETKGKVIEYKYNLDYYNYCLNLINKIDNISELNKAILRDVIEGIVNKNLLKCFKEDEDKRDVKAYFTKALKGIYLDNNLLGKNTEKYYEDYVKENI